MNQIYAKILGTHAALAIENISGVKIRKVEVIGGRSAIESPACELAARVGFSGHVNGTTPVDGCVACGLESARESLPFLGAVARHFDLDEELLAQPKWLDSLVSELLNIIVGRAGADWANHGFEMLFLPPEVISNQAVEKFPSGAKSYHIVLLVDNGPNINVALAFWTPENVNLTADSGQV
ncbi:MAG: hypothetical protein ACRCTY_06160 [Candidatus Adiutrix sp.]